MLLLLILPLYASRTTQTTTVTHLEVSQTTFTPRATATITEVIVIQPLVRVSGCFDYVTTTTYTIVSNLPSLTEYLSATITNSTSYATTTSTISATNVTAITTTSDDSLPLTCITGRYPR